MKRVGKPEIREVGMDNDRRIRRNITIYYFSGTGNTRCIAERLAARFNAGTSYSVVKRMEEVETVTVEPEEMIGIGFPIAAFSTYPVVFDFLGKLPTVPDNPVFGFCTMGGASLIGIIDEVRHRVRKLGFTPAGFCEFRMPLNIFFSFPDAFCRTRVMKAAQQADSFADALADGKTVWKRKLPGSELIFLLADGLFRLTGTKLHQRLLKIRINDEKCTRCGICMRKCPVGNITMDCRITVGNRCQYCLRCVAVCPHDATHAILSPKSLHYRVEQVLTEDQKGIEK